MSELRDIRLLIARQLEASRNVKIALMDVMNIFDAALDAEGWQAPQELQEAIRRLNIAVIDDDEPRQMEDDLLDDEDEDDEVEFVDLVEIMDIIPDDDDDEEE